MQVAKVRTGVSGQSLYMYVLENCLFLLERGTDSNMLGAEL